MGLFAIELSDVGEGVAEAELIEWHVAVGDSVAEDQLLGVVMTDKAAVDVPSSVMGKVVKLCAEVGDVVAVGSPLLHLEVIGDGNVDSISGDAEKKPVLHSDANTDSVDVAAEPASEKPEQVSPANLLKTSNAANLSSTNATVSDTPRQTKSLAAPSVRQRARELGVELAGISGSGPGGRIVHADLDRFTERRANPGASGKQPDNRVEVVKVVGMRRKIAERMSLANSRIPHITIVEEIDVHYLEELREELNNKYAQSRTKLTVLPFIMKAIVEAVAEQPNLNAHYDDEAGEVSQFSGVHIGVATQTDNGLMVPVVQHAEINSLWDNASRVAALAIACRDGTASRDELGGSTITISSLGPMGAIATTPIINHPEVAIVGVNKMMIKPFWDGQQFVPRKIMNVSCSFDHRMVDGWDAAVFVQKIKSLLEKPAMLFLDN